VFLLQLTYVRFDFPGRARFGIGKGDELWRAANKCFDQMPVCAVLDKRIFCVHGGVPREAVRKSEFSFKDIASLPKGCA
jgi:hypothetical protein